MFSTPANLGIVAYALVKGHFGDTPDLNSGISVIHTPGSGSYDIILPGDPSAQEPLQEGQSVSPERDIVIITPMNGGPLAYFASAPSVPNADYVRRVIFTVPTTGTPTDTDFSILILRSLISPPQDAQGNYIAPA